MKHELATVPKLVCCHRKKSTSNHSWLYFWTTMVSRLVYLKHLQHMLASLVQLLVSQGASGDTTVQLGSSSIQKAVIQGREEWGSVYKVLWCPIQETTWVPWTCPSAHRRGSVLIRLQGLCKALSSQQSSSLWWTARLCLPCPLPVCWRRSRSKPRPRERSLEDKGPLERKWVWMWS